MPERSCQWLPQRAGLSRLLPISGSETSLVAVFLPGLQLAESPIVSALDEPGQEMQGAGVLFVFPGLTLYNVTPTRRLNMRLLNALK